MEGLRARIMENELENKVGNEMEIGFYAMLVELKLPYHTGKPFDLPCTHLRITQR